MAERGIPEDYYLAIGYRRIDGIAVRVDALERFSREAHDLARQGPFALTERLRDPIDCPIDRLGAVLSEIGFRRQDDNAESTYVLRGRRRRPAAGLMPTPPATGDHRHSRRRPAKKPDSSSPFARLSELRFTK
jgi:ATP-dependent RNA helicase SUPV3L1/SUV3